MRLSDSGCGICVVNTWKSQRSYQGQLILNFDPSLGHCWMSVSRQEFKVVAAFDPG